MSSGVFPDQGAQALPSDPFREPHVVDESAFSDHENGLDLDCGLDDE